MYLLLKIIQFNYLSGKLITVSASQKSSFMLNKILKQFHKKQADGKMDAFKLDVGDITGKLGRNMKASKMMLHLNLRVSKPHIT